MKTLLVYYSRTQITEKIAKTIQKDLDCEIGRASCRERV